MTRSSNAVKADLSRDWIRADGAVHAGRRTTYMASDVHRQFRSSRSHIWDADFARERLGINFVRTGLWTAWSHAIDNTGNPNEPFFEPLTLTYTPPRTRRLRELHVYAFQALAHGGANRTSTRIARRTRAGSHTSHRGIAVSAGFITTSLTSDIRTAANLVQSSDRRCVRTRSVARMDPARHGDDELLLRNRWQDRSVDLHGIPRENELWYTSCAKIAPRGSCATSWSSRPGRRRLGAYAARVHSRRRRRRARDTRSGEVGTITVRRTTHADAID